MTSANFSPWRRRHEDRGAQAVEFALIVPVLLLLVLGIIDFGYVFGQQLSLNQAVREGARKAVVTEGATQPNIEGFVQDATGGLIAPTSDITVKTQIQDESAGFVGWDPATDLTCADYDGFGGQLRVTAEYPSKWLVPLYGLSVEPPKLTAVATFRCEVVL